MRKLNLILLPLLLAPLFFSSCEKDEKEAPADASQIELAKEILKGDIVLSTTATLQGVDKTLLEGGCPSMFTFTWDKTDLWTPSDPDNAMLLKLDEFIVGNMPMAVWFFVEAKFMELNKWEKEEYTGDGWLKFKGQDGVATSSDSTNMDESDGFGGSAIGYINVQTKEVEFLIDFNLMNVRSHSFLQKIDKDRIKNYEEELADYERRLAEYKEANGL